MNLQITCKLGLAQAQGLRLPGSRRFGVPPGGAFDQIAFAQLIGLMQAELGSVGLELCQAEIEVTPQIGILAAFCLLNGLDANGTELPEMVTIWLEPKKTYRFSTLPDLARGWILLGGGMKGVVAGDQIAKTNIYAVHSSLAMEGRSLPKPRPRLQTNSALLRFVPESEEVLDGLYSVKLDSNRVGVRLECEPKSRGRELPSAPACFGLIQKTPSGDVIVLGPDGPTIGGYERVGVVAEADFKILAQLKPFDKVRFSQISLEAAVQSSRKLGQKESLQQKLLEGIET